MADISTDTVATRLANKSEAWPRRLPELLAPAGDWECARAAVENGADAIYFGLSRFNARMRAKNFTESDLPSLMEFLHQRGVRGYVTFNTLVFENELKEATDYLRSIITSGVDAAIVQDIGVCRLIRSLSPDFPIHGSTQMTVSSAAGVAFARELGCQLVVLARECSVAEIEKIRAAEGFGAQGSLPLEVFVHGALCVAYSGQCLTSEALGGRSANRGECAQACRLPYELISDGKKVDLGDRRYLLSPQDLAGIEMLPEIVKSGVSSLKIEGRLKSPEYVANITRVYRKALDQLASAAESDPRPPLDPSSRYDLEMGFSRGLFTGWFGGNDNQRLVHARFGKKRGVYLGDVSHVGREDVTLALESSIKPGDGIVFDAGTPDQPEEGGRVYEVIRPPLAKTSDTPNAVVLRFGRGDVNFAKIQKGHRVWKTNDPELDRRVRQTFDSPTPQHTRPIRFEAHGALGLSLTLVARDELGNVVDVKSAMPLEAAVQRPLDPSILEHQLGRLGGTGFRLETIDWKIDGAVILPLSELNRMRREVVIQLTALRKRAPRWLFDANGVASTDRRPAASATAPAQEPELVVMVRSLAQLEAALQLPVRTLYCELEDPKKYKEAVARYRAVRGTPTDSEGGLFVAPPRITKMGEDWILKIVRSSEADGYLVRNYDHLEQFKDTRRVGDFSLNVANSFTATYFHERHGLKHLTPSYDLNFEQLSALLQSVPSDWFEVTIHQHMPMFHMEHCVFCAFLSQGKDFRDCGRPCESHEVRLKDRVGHSHPLKADAGCRNTLYNAVAQTGAEYVERMCRMGVRRFRIEFLDESPQAVIQTVGLYQQLLEGKISGSQLWRDLKLKHQLGVTRGQMER